MTTDTRNQIQKLIEATGLSITTAANVAPPSFKCFDTPMKEVEFFHLCAAFRLYPLDVYPLLPRTVEA